MILPPHVFTSIIPKYIISKDLLEELHVFYVTIFSLLAPYLRSY